MASNGGRRSPAIIVHMHAISTIVSDPIFRDRALALHVVHPKFGTLWLISAHLDPSMSRPLFDSSLHDLHELLSVAPFEANIVVGVDANTNFRNVDDTGEFIGPYTSDTLGSRP